VDKFNLFDEDLALGIMRHLLRIGSSSPEPSSGGRKKTLDSLGRRYAIYRVAKFAVASGIGFLIAEVILVIGVLIFYHNTNVPSVAYSSFTILGLNALAFGIGVTVALIINERVTVRGQVEEGSGKRRANWFKRWGKYQLASLLGNVVIVGVQLTLLATFSLSPVFGNIIGAIVSYPVTYFVSMRFVWGVRPLGEK
jgi:putative flippase GtrA